MKDIYTVEEIKDFIRDHSLSYQLENEVISYIKQLEYISGMVACCKADMNEDMEKRINDEYETLTYSETKIKDYIDKIITQKN